jgi:hypothetical protein
MRISIFCGNESTQSKFCESRGKSFLSWDTPRKVGFGFCSRAEAHSTTNRDVQDDNQFGVLGMYSMFQTVRIDMRSEAKHSIRNRTIPQGLHDVVDEINWREPFPIIVTWPWTWNEFKPTKRKRSKRISQKK